MGLAVVSLQPHGTFGKVGALERRLVGFGGRVDSCLVSRALAQVGKGALVIFHGVELHEG